MNWSFFRYILDWLHDINTKSLDKLNKVHSVWLLLKSRALVFYGSLELSCIVFLFIKHGFRALRVTHSCDFGPVWHSTRNFRKKDRFCDSSKRKSFLAEKGPPRKFCCNSIPGIFQCHCPTCSCKQQNLLSKICMFAVKLISWTSFSNFQSELPGIQWITLNFFSKVHAEIIFLFQTN